MRLLDRIDRVIGFAPDNPIAAEFGRERIRSIRRFIFVYYLSILAPFLGAAAHHADHIASKVMGGIILLAVLLRFRHWVFPVPAAKSEDINPVAARVTAAMVTILSLSQFAFYAALAFTGATEWRGSLLLIAIGVIAGLTQAAALTGIIFASRVIFFGLIAPLVVSIPMLMPAFDMPVSLAVALLCAIAFRLAEASHDTQLQLFKTRYDADITRRRAESMNGELFTARKAAEREANIDGLTGARNRFAFLRDVSACIEDGHAGILMLVDLDRFKPINDLYGHHAGDIALRYVTRRLSRALPGDAIIGRLGGDEFGVFLRFGDGHQDVEDLTRACDAALARLRRPIRVANSTVTLGSSGGARLLGPETADMEQALRDADTALYAAKRDGMETVRMFDGELHEVAMRAKAVEAALLSLDPGKALTLVYQPIFNLETGELSCFEALARWKDPVLGTVSPMEFIPMAEQLGRIEAITFALLERALSFAREWAAPCGLSFNLSAAHICSADAATQIVDVVQRSGFPADRLQFEITETAMLVNFDVARRNVEALRAAGCRLALDDFGAGFASLVHLREIRFDRVKIDGSLTYAARTPDGRDMLRGVITMIEAMKLEAVAEYVATDHDLANVCELGAGFGQGFHLSAPLDEEGVRALLRYSAAEGAKPVRGRGMDNVIPFGRTA